MGFKVYTLLVIFKMVSSLPDSSVKVNVNVDADNNKSFEPDYNTKCEDIGGECVLDGKSCPDMKPIKTSGPPYCKTPSPSRCCYQRRTISPEACLAKEGGTCYYFYPSSQCFCMAFKFPAANFNWEQARQNCSQHGWLLPHPIDAVAIRRALVEHFGNIGPFWLNAKYSVPQSNMVWWDTYSLPGQKVVITTQDTLIASPPQSFKDGDCLEMSAQYGGNADQPYAVANCDDPIKNNHHILCLRVY